MQGTMLFDKFHGRSLSKSSLVIEVECKLQGTVQSPQAKNAIPLKLFTKGGDLMAFAGKTCWPLHMISLGKKRRGAGLLPNEPIGCAQPGGRPSRS